MRAQRASALGPSACQQKETCMATMPCSLDSVGILPSKHHALCFPRSLGFSRMARVFPILVRISGVGLPVHTGAGGYYPLRA